MTPAVRRFINRVAESEIKRLRATNAELLAALEGLLSATGVDAYHAAEDAAHAAIAKAKEASHG